MNKNILILMKILIYKLILNSKYNKINKFNHNIKLNMIYLKIINLYKVDLKIKKKLF